jgi:hypothetical protein
MARLPPLRLRVQLKGENARLGRIPAADVGRLLLGVERTVAQAAAAIMGRHRRPGRRPTPIEATTRLRLIALKSGSVIGVLELPRAAEDADEALPLEDMRLGDLALDATLDTLTGEQEEIQIAQALAELADEIGIGTKYDGVVFEERKGQQRRRATLNPRSRERIRVILEGAALPRKRDALVGTLVEADFERFTARLRTPGGGRVVVTFPPLLADDIQMALRHQAEFEGHISYDPKTETAVKVELRRIVRGEQMILLPEPGLFWANPSVDELRLQQGVEAVTDVTALREWTATEEEVDAFLAALEE